MNFYFFIKFAVEAEAKLEEIRVLLASLDNFEPFTTYKRLDQPRTGGLQPQDIFEFLNDNDIQVTQEQLDYIFRVLDEDTDGLITYQDFKSAILPKMNDQVKDQALNHKGYDLPVDMQLPNEIETQLSKFFIQIKQNYIQYQQIQQKIDLNQLDIYDNDNLITLDSLKNWLQQQEQDISEEILQNFIIIIQGQQKLLQNLLDQIYLENQEDQDENYDQEQQQEDNENADQEQIQEDQEQIQQQEELEQEQEQQNDIEADLDEKDSQQNPQQEVHSQELDYNNQNINNDLQNDIEFEIYQLKNKIYQLEIQLEIPSQQTNTYYIGQLFGKEQNRQKFSRTSYLNRFDHSLCYYGNDFMRQKIWLDEEIQREEIKQKILLNQLKNSGKINYYSSFISDRSYNQIQHSPLNKSKYTSDYSGSKYSVSNRKPYLSSFQKSINFSNRKF